MSNERERESEFPRQICKPDGGFGLVSPVVLFFVIPPTVNSFFLIEPA